MSMTPEDSDRHIALAIKAVKLAADSPQGYKDPKVIAVKQEMYKLRGVASLATNKPYELMSMQERKEFKQREKLNKTDTISEDGVVTRICTTCKDPKTIDNYERTFSGYYRSVCKKCRVATQNKAHQKEKERKLVTVNSPRHGG
jgi:hypothetical protein